MIITLSRKAMVRKVNYLLSTVNLTFDLLIGLKKRTIYNLLKKAAKINPDLALEKQELKELAKLISQEKLTSKKLIDAYKTLLKVEDTIEVENKETEVEPIESTFVFSFFDRKQIIRV